MIPVEIYVIVLVFEIIVIITVAVVIFVVKAVKLRSRTNASSEGKNWAKEWTLWA